jgi:hypothetical protein
VALVNELDTLVFSALLVIALVAEVCWNRLETLVLTKFVEFAVGKALLVIALVAEVC